MNIFLIIFIIVSVLSAINELTTLIVYGRWIPEKYLDKYFDKNLDAYRYGHKSGYLLHGGLGNTFISTNFSLFSKYYLHGLGTIPRWSKWTKELNNIVWDI